jgi:esterase/lipase superfamily enzyme
MSNNGNYPTAGPRRRRMFARDRIEWLACAWLLLAPGFSLAQSVALFLPYQKFEQAVAAGDYSGAEKYGRDALAAAQSAPGSDAHDLIDLLRSVAEVCAKAGDDQQAMQFYQLALAKQESELGADHPDLVPLLSALVDLHLRNKEYPAAEELLQRILKIERAAYGERHDNVLLTLKQLRDTYRAAGDTAAAARTSQQIDGFGSASKEVANTTFARGFQAKDSRYKMNNGYATVRVFYGTDRKPTGKLKPVEFYGKERSDLQYGYLDVTIPEVHQEAQLETQPSWDLYSFVVGDAGSRYVLLDQVTPLTRDDFINKLRQQIKDSPSQDVFIFVHGFNSTFEDAARRCAQLAYDLDFDGTPMMFSWASAGSATAYMKDEATVTASGRKMAQMLDDVVARSGARRVHLIAHSMGNRALMEALQTYLARRAPAERRDIFDQIVFTAPDVDREYFVNAIDSLAPAAKRVTLYASDTDLALQSSQILHDAPRAGLAGVNIISLPSIDTIDMSAVPADSLGHSYFAANNGAIYDLFRLFWRGEPPPDRCGMSYRKSAGLVRVWLFNVDICRGDALLVAGELFKRMGAQALTQAQANVQALTDPSQKQQWQSILSALKGLLANDTQSAAPVAGPATPGAATK